VLGIQCEKEISQVLIDSDYGISTTPYFQTEKSGVYAAYREHQINTICVSRKWTPTKGQYNIPQIIKYEKNNLNLIPIDVEVFDLHSMSSQFINSISKI
jgi:cellulose biosynthesis protein BcsQ